VDTDPLSQKPKVDEPLIEVIDSRAERSSRVRKGLKILGALTLIGGFLVLGLFVGFFISFGACFKQECSPLEAGAPLLVPAATLLFTIPAARKILRRKD